MHRKKVLLPEPDGPIRQSTSFGDTSRSMSLSTSSRPKLFCTASALTMAGLLTLTVLAAGHGRCRWRQLRRRWRRRVEREQHPPEPLKRSRWRPPQRTAAEMSFDVILADGKDRCHDQVPDAGYDQQFEDVVGRGGNLLLAGKKLRDRGRE